MRTHRTSGSAQCFCYLFDENFVNGPFVVRWMLPRTLGVWVHWPPIRIHFIDCFHELKILFSSTHWGQVSKGFLKKWKNFINYSFIKCFIQEIIQLIPSKVVDLKNKTIYNSYLQQQI